MKRQRSKSSSGNRTGSFRLESLERRVLFSADLPFLADGLLMTAGDAAPEVMPVSNADPEPVSAALESLVEIVIVDVSTPDYEQIVADLTASENKSYEIHLLNGEQNGITQITDILSGYDNVGALHLISHGNDGEITLGNSAIGLVELLSQADQVAGWQDSFSEQGDLLIYGCDLAATQSGQNFVTTLGQLTGTDVAASNDLTGSALLGGDWQLEFAVGAVETELAVSAELQNSYEHVLAIFTVDNLNDSGSGSLRQAILDADGNTGADAIEFSVAGTISLLSALPDISEQIHIDGSSAPGYSGQPVITLDGFGAGAANGLTLIAGSNGSTIRGLAIGQFSDAGIKLINSDNNLIVGNYIGTNNIGTVGQGNGGKGIDVQNSAGNQIGGSTALDRNLISSNGGDGIILWGADSTGNTIQGNYIGVDASGDTALGNLGDGISIANGANNNTIGGDRTAGEGNVLSGNSGVNGDGIEIDNAGADNNRIYGNYIGTNQDGTAAIANARHGVVIYDGVQNTQIGGTGTGQGNIIAGNTTNGVVIDGNGLAATTNNIIAGNTIGLDVSGTGDLGNGGRGVYIFGGATANVIGGTTAAHRNVISGNDRDGIDISGASTTGTIIQGNYIGTDSAGMVGIRNEGNGIRLTGNMSATVGGIVAGSGNVISGNTNSGTSADGIFVTGGGSHIIQGNYLGLASDGATVLGNYSSGIAISSSTNNLIGGTTAAARNVISGNAIGVSINGSSSMNLVVGNYIGTDATGMLDRGNTTDGVVLSSGAQNNTIGGATTNHRNVISGNNNDGIWLTDTATANNTVQGNWIGLDVAGGALGNSFHGIGIENGAADNLVGGTATGAENRIAHNAWDGITVAGSGTGNSLLGNEIYANGDLAIDLADNGVSANDTSDTDPGANNLQNYPLLSHAATDGAGRIIVEGSINSTASTTYRIEFFASATPDGSSHGEAERYLGFTSVTTDGSGDASFSEMLDAAVAAGEYVTATATVDSGGGNYGDTSEFSQNLVATTAMQMQTGSYIGDGVDGRIFAGLGFQPDFIVLQSESGLYSTVVRTSDMTGDNTKALIDGMPLFTNGIESLNADGFTVGDDGRVNADGETYHWTAFSAGAGEMTIGTYTGNSADDRSISGFGFQPDYAIVMGGGAHESVHRFQDQTGDASMEIGSSAVLSNVIQDFESDGLQIGSDNRVNQSGQAYYYVAWREVEGKTEFGTYTGDGNDDRAITDVGFQADYLLVKLEGAGDAVHRMGSMTGDATLGIGTDAVFANGIQQFSSTGFEVGNHITVNWSGQNYYYAAFNANTAPLGAPAISSDGGAATADVNVAENTTAVTTVTATDPDLDILTYSISGGIDAGFFSIDSSTGELTFNSAPDFENPLDDDLNNTYEVQVMADDGNGGTDTQNISVSVTNILELVVTTTNATGTGSLHQAIMDANANVGVTDSITFNIGGGGPQTIMVDAAGLPDITDSVVLDATTQPGYSGIPLITLDGAATPVSSGINGITIRADDSTVKGFIVINFADEGIEVDGSTGFGDNNIVQSNWVGIDKDGNVAGVAEHGIMISVDATGNQIGGAGPGEGNLVSGNGLSGIMIRQNSDNNIVEGNIVGLKSDGVTPAGNGTHGIVVETSSDNNRIGGTTPGAGNIISGNTQYGIQINGATNATHTTAVTGTLIQGNRIGLDLSGTVAVGNSNAGIYVENGAASNIIGGTGAGSGNVISGNADGIFLRDAATTGNLIQGNLIGTDITGTVDLGNSDRGIQIESGASFNIIGGTNAGARNIISGNGNDGIVISDFDGFGTTGNVVQGNYIGTDITGTLDLGNSGHGVHITTPSDNAIGGAPAGAGNLIAFNSWSGVLIQNSTATGNTILGNAIHSQGGLAIDLGDDNVSDNDSDDSDTGSNNLQNFPLITNAATDGSTTITIDGTFVSQPNMTYRIEFFASSSQDGSGHGEAERYLGFATVATNGSGNATFSEVLSAAVAVGEFVTATATVDLEDGNYGDTSEFSANFVAVSGNTAPTSIGISDIVLNEDPGFSFLDLNAIFADAEDLDAALVYTVTNNTNPALFDSASINGSGTLSLDYAAEQNGFSDLTIRATDTGGLYVETTFRVTLNAVNDAPVRTAGSVNDLVVIEDSGLNSLGFGGLAYSAGGGGDESGQTLVFEVTVIPDSNFFGKIYLADGTTQVGTGFYTLTDIQGMQFESEPDVNGGPSFFSFRVVDSGGTANGGNDTLTETIRLDITPDNDDPIFTSAASFDVSENGSAVGVVTSTDVDGGAPQYTLVGAVDDGLFSIDINTGVLSFNTAPDFEAAVDSGLNNVYDITIQVNDGSGGIVNQNVAVTVTDANDNSTTPISDADVALEAIDEDAGVGDTVGITAFASDADSGDSITYTLDVDAGGLFILDSNTGVVTVNAALDYETAASHDIRVRATSTDASFTTRDFTITVGDVNDNLPVITPAQTFSVNENAAVNDPVGAVLATDVDTVGTLQGWTITAGNTDGIFQIDSATGVVTIADATNLNFEATTQYTLTLQVGDGANSSASETVVIDINNINEAPTFTSSPNTAGTEDAAYSYTITANDVDGDVINITDITLPSWLTLIDNGDGTATLTGTPANAGVGPNTIELQVSDGSLTSDQNFTLTVTNVNDDPVFSSPNSFNVTENVTSVGTVTSTDVDGGAPQYTLVGAVDDGHFSIDVNTGVLSFNTAPDFEAAGDSGLNNVYDITVQVNDGSGGIVNQNVAVTVTDANDNSTTPISDADVALDAIDEDAGVGDTVGITAFASDADSGDSITYTLDVDAGGLFILDSNTGVVTVNAALDYETAASHDIRVRATSTDASFTTRDFTITVGDVNDNLPVITPAQTFSVNENAAVNDPVGAVLATDVDTVGTLQGWTITAGNTDGIFQINSATGMITVADNTNLNFESAIQYTLTVQVGDGVATSATETVVININDVNEVPTFTSMPITGGTEDTAYAYTITTSDVDGDSVTITDMTLPAWLTLNDNGDGTATLTGIPANADVGPHTIELQVSDGSLTSDQNFTLTVTNVNDDPVFSSPNSFNVTENVTSVGTVTSTDVDGGAPQYTLVGAVDDGHFSIDVNTGVLSFNTAPDFEAAGDSGLNNVYDITVQVNDGSGGIVNQNVAVTVTDANDNSTTSISDADVALEAIDEDAGVGDTVGITAFASDADSGDSITYTLDVDAGGLFILDSNTGVVTVNAALDYETAASHDIRVRATSTDASFTTRDFTITVGDVNDNLPVITPAQTFSVNENAAVNDPVGAVLATDVDTVGTLQGWTITAGNTDGIFQIDSATGAVTIADTTSLNFEATTQYTLTLQVGDGANTSAAETVVIDINDINEPPTFTSMPITGGTEDTAYAYTITTSDVDGDSVTITDMTLPAWLTLNDNGDGTATLTGIPANANVGPHTIELQVSDGSLTSDQNFTLTVTNVNDDPVFSSPNSFNVTENVTAVGTVTSTDVDGGAPQYTLVGAVDDGLFSIDINTGVLSFNAAPDYDAAGDVGGDNVYDITVQVNDGNGGIVNQNVAITVTNLNEFGASPINDVDGASNTVAENASVGTLVGVTASASDADAPDNITYTLDNDAGSLFAIDGNTGVVTVNTAPDYEAATSHLITVRATSTDTSFTTQDFIVVIGDVNDNAPVITPAQTFSVNESAAVNDPVGTAIATDVDTVGTLQGWTITAGNTDGIFQIDSATGMITIADATNLNFEAANQYTLTLQVGDGANTSAAETVVIDINDINEAPTFTSTPITGGTEDTAYAYTITTSDVDGDPVTITDISLPSWLSLLDNGDGTAVLTGTPINADVGAHTVEVQVSDGTLTSAQSFILNVANVNDEPVVTSSNSYNVAENNVAIGTVTTTDVDGGIPQYRLVGTVDDALFSIDLNTGLLSFVVMPDFENPGDTGTDNTYQITVQVDDGAGGVVLHTITTIVTDVNEAPQILNLIGGVIDEGIDSSPGYSVGQLTASDPDAADSLSYAVIGGLDSDLFSIGGPQGDALILTTGVLDFENQNNYDVQIRVTDANGLYIDRTLSVVVNDLNDSPQTVADTLQTLEDTALLINLQSDLLANDSDQDGDSLSVLGLSQPANGILMDNLDGTWTYLPDLNFNGTDQFQYQISDGNGGTSWSVVDIQVLSVNDAPTLTSPGNLSVMENLTGPFTQIQGSDADNDPLTLSISGGADAGAFQLDAASGSLAFISNPNFEAPVDSNADNIYELELSATDSFGAMTTQQLQVQVMNVNEAPTLNTAHFVSNEGFTGTIGSVSLSDPDTGDLLTLTIIGGNAQTAFEIDPVTGEIIQRDPIAPGIYTLDIQVTDTQGATVTGTLTISINADNQTIVSLPDNDPATREIVESKLKPTILQGSIENIRVEDSAIDEAKQSNLSAETEGSADTDNPTTRWPGAFSQAFSIHTDAPGLSNRDIDPGDLPNGGNSAVRGYDLLLQILFEEAEEASGLFLGMADSGQSNLLSATLSPTLLGALNSMRTDMDNQNREAEEQLQLLVRSGTVATLSLTAGFVTWLLRTGSLLATALSTSPLWRTLDPIPVLVAPDEEEKQEFTDDRS